MEINCECPKEMQEEVTESLKSCMKRAGAYFCKSLEVPADAEISTHWVH